MLATIAPDRNEDAESEAANSAPGKNPVEELRLFLLPTGYNECARAVRARLSEADPDLPAAELQQRVIDEIGVIERTLTVAAVEADFDGTRAVLSGTTPEKLAERDAWSDDLCNQLEAAGSSRMDIIADGRLCRAYLDCMLGPLEGHGEAVARVEKMIAWRCRPRWQKQARSAPRPRLYRPRQRRSAATRASRPGGRKKKSSRHRSSDDDPGDDPDLADPPRPGAGGGAP